MNIALHQLRKDIVRTRLLLALWFLLIVVKFTLLSWNIKPGDILLQTLLPVLGTVLSLFNALLILVLVPLVIHQEPLVGTTAFWFTLPLRRGTLLFSKTIYVLLLILIPLLVQTVVFAAGGVTAHDVLLAVPQLFLDQFSWIIIVATLAVLTPNFARFVIAGAIVLVGWYLALFILEMVSLVRDPGSLVSSVPSLTLSRGVVESAILIAFGCTAVVLQYLTRRTPVVIALGLTALVLSLAAAFCWPWDFLKPPPRFVPDANFKIANVTVRLTKPIYVSDQVQIRGGTPLKQINGHLDFQGYPPGYVMKVESVFSTLKTADGREIPTQPVPSLFDFSGNNDPDAISRALSNVPVLNGTPSFASAQGLFSVASDVYDKDGSLPLDFSATLSGRAYKYIVATELPLKKGARYDHDSDHLTLTDILTQPDGVDIMVRERKMHLLFAPSGDDASPYSPIRTSEVYVLLNKKLREAVVQKRDLSVNFSVLNQSGMLSNEPARISFVPDDNNADSSSFPKLDRAWLADAVLVRLELVPVVGFDRTLSVKGFRLDGKSDLPAANSPPRGPSAETLSEVTLPPHPTPDQVRTYITKVVALSLDPADSDDDPDAMLEKVGPENVDLLIDAERGHYNYHLNRAIEDLVQPDQKELVLQALPVTPGLIDTVVEHGWQQDAWPILLAALGDTSRQLPNLWLVTVASYHDPATYPALREDYVASPNMPLFDALKALPDFDLAGMVDQAWKQRGSGYAWKIGQLLEPAAQFNEPGVLDAAVTMLETGQPGKREARRALRLYTPAQGKSDHDLVTWMKANRANLVFNPQAHKFVLRAPGSPAAVQAPPPPAATPAPAAH